MVDPALPGRTRHHALAQASRGPAGRARPDRGVYRRLSCALLGGLLMILAASSEARPAVKQVLILQSLNRGNLILDNFTGNFRVSLDQRVGEPVNVVQVVVGPTGFVGAHEQAVVDYIRAMYAERPPPDLIVTAGGPAAVFARNHRRELFPATPVLLASVDQRFLQGAPLGENETAVAVVTDFPGVIDEILRVLPETRQVFMVLGSGAIGQFWRRELETGFARFRGRVTFIWSDELSLEETLRRCASLPSHSAIFYITFGTDAQGGAYADEQVLADLHARANAPLFAAHTPLFGYGIVGGSMMDVSDFARDTADVASRILNGEPAGSIRVPPHLPGQPIFDWRELQRWGIPESRLPAGSVVQFRSPSLWDEYKLAILTAVGVLIFQSLLIAWLLYEHRRRQRATRELDQLNTELEARIATRTAALDTKSRELETFAYSVAHDLKAPLRSIDGYSRLLVEDYSTDLADEARHFIGNIQTSTEEMSELIDDLLAYSRMERSDFRPDRLELQSFVNRLVEQRRREDAEQKIDFVSEVNGGSVVADVNGLTVALRNYLDNAVKFTQRVPQPRIEVGAKETTSNCLLWVRDNGIGFDIKYHDQIFGIFQRLNPAEEFPGTGIGLAIVRKAMERMGGRAWAESEPGRGATFYLEIPKLNGS